MQFKLCNFCGRVLPLSEYYLDKRRNWVYARCKDCQKQYLCEYYKKHPRSTTKNREYMKIYMRTYSKTEEQKKRVSKWLKTDKGKAFKARARHRRKSNFKSTVCDLTQEQWEEIKQKQDYKCAICGEELPLHRDHIIPLSKGGNLTKDNVQGLCKSCNSKKSNKVSL